LDYIKSSKICAGKQVGYPTNLLRFSRRTERPRGGGPGLVKVFCFASSLNYSRRYNLRKYVTPKANVIIAEHNSTVDPTATVFKDIFNSPSAFFPKRVNLWVVFCLKLSYMGMIHLDLWRTHNGPHYIPLSKLSLSRSQISTSGT
jgi:hypothetical protein